MHMSPAKPCRNRPCRLAMIARRMICLLVASLALRILPGCSGPKFEAKQFERRQHLDHLQWVLDNEEILAAHRKEYLENTSQTIAEGLVGTRRWNEFADDREWWLRHGLRGRPECIPNAWAKMVY